MKPYLHLMLVLAWTVAANGGDATRWIYQIDTVAGSSGMGDGGPATAAQIGNIQGVAVDRQGNVYLSDTDHHRVRKVDVKGVITTVAGTGIPGYSGDGGPAASAQLNLPYGLAMDVAGNLYVADYNNNRVRRITPDGRIATYAGSGGQGSGGDGGPAISALLLQPRNLAVDAAGNLYISEFGANRVRQVTTDGKISTAAGTGVAGFWGDGGPATNAQLAFPAGLAVDRAGALYIADTQNERIRKILPSGQISTAIGGTPDITLATPIAVAVDLNGNIYVADKTSLIHERLANGTWTIAAGTSQPGFWGDGGAATAAQLVQPLGLALDLTGSLYIADAMRIREVDGHGIIHTLAGDDYLHFVGDGGSALAADLYQPSAIALDAAGNLFLADTLTQRVRQVSPSGIMTTVAGTGVASPGKEAVPAATAPLDYPQGVVVDQAGNVIIAETEDQRIRQVSADGKIRTIMGTGAAGVGPENVPPSQTLLRGPRGLCMDRAGNLYVADTANHRVLKAPPGGVVTTAAGNGAPGFAGDGGPARLAQLTQPNACALDSFGDLFIADTFNHLIREVDSQGIIHTVAGTGQQGDGGDEGPATAANLNTPRGLAVDDNGNIYIADTGNSRIRQVTPDGVIHTIGGTGAAGFAGDGEPALAAQIDTPEGILLDGAGDLYFCDTNNNRVRRLTPTAVVRPAPVYVPPPLTVENAAGLTQGPVAPGEVVSIFGMGLGPAAGVGGMFDSSGLLANQLAGTEVRFDGVPAPLFYTQAAQINAQVPYTVAGEDHTHMEVFYQGNPVGTLDIPVVAAAPAIFGTLVNQDGTFNSETNPAPRGTFLTFYATGEGLTNGPNVSGLPAGAPYPSPLLPVTVTVAGMLAETSYAGSAPGEIGLLQVNLRVPGSYVPSGAVMLELTVGTAVAPDVTVWVK